MKTPTMFAGVLIVVAGACTKKEEPPPPIETLVPEIKPLQQPEAKPDAPSFDCRGLLTAVEVEDACEVNGLSRKGGNKQRLPCLLRFKKQDQKRASLVVELQHFDETKKAQEAFTKRQKKAKKAADFKALSELGPQAQSYSMKKGKGSKQKTVPVVDYAQGNFVLQVRAPFHQSADPVCTKDKLPQFAELLGKRIAKVAGGSPAEKPVDAPGVEQAGPPKGASAEPGGKPAGAAAAAKPAAAKSAPAGTETKPAAGEANTTVEAE